MGELAGEGAAAATLAEARARSGHDGRIVVVMNRGAGRSDVEASRRAIDEVLHAAGRPYEIIVAGSGAEIAREARAARERAAVVVGAGGDGTLSTVAAELAGTGVAFGVIPLGTFNYFARDRGIPLDPAAAARTLLDGRIVPIPAATINGRVFLNNASVGLYRRLLEEREQFKQRLGRYRGVAAIAGFATLVRHHRNFELELAVDGRPHRLRTPMVFFANNALQLEGVDLPVAGCVRRAEVAVLVLKPMSRLALLGFALRGATLGLRESENLATYCARAVRVQRRARRSIRVAIDGETVRCALPLTIEVHPGALSVVLPREPEPRV